MTTAEIISEIRRLPDVEREELFSILADTEEWREDLLDILTLHERRFEPSRPAEDAFRDLGINE